MSIMDDSRPLLAIDTSTAFLSLALRIQGETHLFHQEAANRQSEWILPQIQNLLDQTNVKINELAAIVYAQGPGAFTGLRIGASVAQGLSAPFHLPLIGIPTLDAVASLAHGSCVLAAMDARMGEVFHAWFDTENHQRLSDYQVSKASDITLPEGKTYSDGIGNAFALDPPPPFAGRADMPTASDYLQLALTQRYRATTANLAELLYVRDKVALTAQEQAQRRHAP